MNPINEAYSILHGIGLALEVHKKTSIPLNVDQVQENIKQSMRLICPFKEPVRVEQFRDVSGPIDPRD